MIAASQLFDAQVASSAAAGAAAWTPISTTAHLIFGQFLKRFRWFRNRWLDVALPVIAVIGVVAMLVIGKYLGYSVHPLSGFAFFSSHFGGGVGSKIVYNGQKVPDPDHPEQGGFLTKIPGVGPIIANSLPPGPDNHPEDAAEAAATPSPPAPSPPPPMPAPTPPPAAPTIRPAFPPPPSH